HSPYSPLFPYTTLFRSDYWGMSEGDLINVAGIVGDLGRFPELADRNQQGLLNFMVLGRLMTLPDGLVSHAAFQGGGGAPAIAPRSEEHTSELQSRENLV